jgi:hypothetical protein
MSYSGATASSVAIWAAEVSLKATAASEVASAATCVASGASVAMTRALAILVVSWIAATSWDMSMHAKFGDLTFYGFF